MHTFRADRPARDGTANSSLNGTSGAETPLRRLALGPKWLASKRRCSRGSWRPEPGATLSGASARPALADSPPCIDEVMWVNRYWPMVFKQIVEALGA